MAGLTVGEAQEMVEILGVLRREFSFTLLVIDPNIALGVERSLLPPLMAVMGGNRHRPRPVFGSAIIRIIETVFFHYLRLPVPSMLFFGITLLAVAC